MKTLYIFIAAGGPAGGRAGGRGGRAAAAQCREAACPGGPGGRTRARVPPGVARRGGAAGGVRGELPPPLGTRVWPGSRPRTSLRPLVPRGAARPEQARARGAQGDSGLRLAPSGDPRAAPLGGHVLGPAVSSPVGPRRAPSPRSRLEAPACCGPRAPP